MGSRSGIELFDFGGRQNGTALENLPGGGRGQAE
jgi:hypothetical protein